MSADPVAQFRRHPRRLDVLIDSFRPLYELLFDENDSFVVNLERKLAEARMEDTVEVYLTRALAFGTICGVLLWLIGAGIALGLIQAGIITVGPWTGIQVPNATLVAIIEALRTPLLILVSGTVIGSIGFAAVFMPLVALPYSRASARNREINALLPDAVSFMYALSLGGMSQIEIIRTMAAAEETYGEVSREFHTILRETEFFDTDYRSAIQNRAAETPSMVFSQFLTDMLSIIDSGGSITEFLDDKKDVHFRHAREDQQRTLDTLELFSEMYITISLFPLLLIVILVILDMIGGSQELLLYGTVYALIPGLGLAFLVIVATVRQDEFGSGYLAMDAELEPLEFAQRSGPLDLGLINAFRGKYRIFERIADQEGTYAAISVLKRPHIFLRENPLFTLAVSVPAAVSFVVMAILSGSVATDWGGVIAEPVWATIVYLYLPLFIVCIPLAVFYEWNIRRRRAILDGLSEHLRKLASANATGLTLLESIKVVADTTPGRLGDEFATIHSKSNYGMHLKESLIVFNNKYRVPRLARTVKLISTAQEISSQISSVLTTAARATENQEDIERERTQRATLHVGIIILTFLTLLGVMALLKAQFIEVMAGVTADSGNDRMTGNFGTSMDLNLLSMLFLHAVTLQAILSGLVSGYIRDASLLAGVKYVVGLALATLGVWMVVA